MLARYDGGLLRIVRQGSMLEIVPLAESSFPVSLFDEGPECMVAAQRWHAHIDDPQQAAFCAFWLLTPFYRVVQELKGGVLVAAWVERYEGFGWNPMEPVFFLNPVHAESWVPEPGEGLSRRTTQQDVLRPADYRTVVPDALLDRSGLPPDFRGGAYLEPVSELIGRSLSGA